MKATATAGESTYAGIVRWSQPLKRPSRLSFVLRTATRCSCSPRTLAVAGGAWFLQEILFADLPSS